MRPNSKRHNSRRRYQLQSRLGVDPAPLRYIQYVRRSSSKGSRKQEQSLTGQKQDLAKLQNDLELHLVDALEESQTAKEPGRPVFNALIRRIENGEANAILCWHLDRLTRNEIDSGTLRWLLRNGVIREIRTPTRVYRSEDSALITALESAIGEQFIPDHIAKVQRGMLQKCAAGGIPFRVPEGYLNDKLTRGAQADPSRFPLIRQAFQLVLTGSCSVREAHRIFHEEWGYRKRERLNSTSSALSLSAFYDLLANPFYCGYFTWQGQVYLHNLPRVVTKDEFDRVQAILKRRSYKKTRRHTFAYTGLIHCASCGYAVTAEVSKGHTYYHCPNRLGTCTKKGVREEELDARLDSLLASIEMPPEFEALATEILASMSQEERETDHAKTQAREGALQELKTQRERLLSLYLQGHLEPEEYAERKHDLSEREVRLLLEAEQGVEWQGAEETVANALHFSVHARGAFAHSEPLLRRFVARQITDDLTLNNGELNVRLHPAFEPVRGWKAEDGGRGPDEPSESDGGSKVRTFSPNGATENQKFEPSSTPVFNLKGAEDEANFQLWWTRLHQYRTFAREHNCFVPRMSSSHP